MTTITEFLDENDLSAADVIDALDIDPSNVADVPEEPTDFYDGEPSIEDLADDFDAVDLLADKKESLEAEVASLTDEVRAAKRPVFEEKAEELAALTDKWGEKDELLDRFEAEDADLRWDVSDITDKIELVEDIKGEQTTTVGDEQGGESTTDSDPAFDTTDHGRFDLRQNTAFGK